MQVTIDFPIIADPKREVAIKCMSSLSPNATLSILCALGMSPHNACKSMNANKVIVETQCSTSHDVMDAHSKPTKDRTH